jgi:hypothetical protein
MSLAGVHSNRGDNFQTLVAFEWAMSILIGSEEYEWIEIDSTALDSRGLLVEVDDVIVGKGNRNLVCCQAKKNQPAYSTWSVNDLRDELAKAFRQWSANKDSNIKFYSRSPFGHLHNLTEHAKVHGDIDAFETTRGVDQEKTYVSLKNSLSGAGRDEIWMFLRRLAFEVVPDFDRAKEKLKERLGQFVTNQASAYDAIWRLLDECAARLADQTQLTSTANNRITRVHLQKALKDAGCYFAPRASEQELNDTFKRVSAIGRTWRREIASERLPITATDALREAVAAEEKLVVLAGLPGGGKTCVLLQLVDELEEKSDCAVLFVQARAFANADTHGDRVALGFPQDAVEPVAQMADIKRVVVIVDSLDVLSISNHNGSLGFFLNLIDQWACLLNVTIIVACREFDLKYDQHLAERQWNRKIICGALDWDTTVAPLLARNHIDTSQIDDSAKSLLRNPLDLSLFVDISKHDKRVVAKTHHMLALSYLNSVVRENSLLGDKAMDVLQEIATAMLKNRRLDIVRAEMNVDEIVLKRLCSEGVIAPSEFASYRFRHQTLLDTLIVLEAHKRNASLLDLIQSLSPVPFVRPVVRSFVASIAAINRVEVRTQIRAVIASGVAYHLKRLVVECFANEPVTDDDWSFVRDLYINHRDLFYSLYFRATTHNWYTLLESHFVPFFVSRQDVDALVRHVSWVAQFKERHPKSILEFWTQALSLNWSKSAQIDWTIANGLADTPFVDTTLVSSLIQLLMKRIDSDSDAVGRVLAKAVKDGVVSDQLLWEYVAGDIKDEDLKGYSINEKNLRCEKHDFGNSEFFQDRMRESPVLLFYAIQTLERWSTTIHGRYETKSDWYFGFLNDTTWEFKHSKHDMYHVGAINELLRSIESAICHHAAVNSDWWIKNAKSLSKNREGALRYFAIKAITANAEMYPDLAASLLLDRSFFRSELSFEYTQLCRAAFPYVGEKTQNAVMRRTIRMWRALNPSVHIGLAQRCTNLISVLPAYLRTEECNELLECWRAKYGVVQNDPEIRSQGGMVHAPFGDHVFHRATDDGVVRLLSHYVHDRWSAHESGHLVGGAEAVERVLCTAASQDPVRFLNLLCQRWLDIPSRYRDEILAGAADHLMYLYGRVRPPDKWEPIEKPNSADIAKLLLNEIERHPLDWRGARAAAKAVNGCASVVDTEEDIYRTLFAAIGFSGCQEAEDSHIGDDRDLVFRGINMTRGHAVQAALTLIGRAIEQQQPLPTLGVAALKHFALDQNPAIKALVLRKLPSIQFHHPDVGWHIFALSIYAADEALWSQADLCLYYGYHRNFAIVSRHLNTLRSSCHEEGLALWGRISALAVLSRHLDSSSFIDDLNQLRNAHAWRGALSVWVANCGDIEHCDVCWESMRAFFKRTHTRDAESVNSLGHLFQSRKSSVNVPLDIVVNYFEELSHIESKNTFSLHSFDEWLLNIVVNYPDSALNSAEHFIRFVKSTKRHHLWLDKSAKWLTRLFREAEEREASDSGAMVKRVIAVQDDLLSLNVSHIQNWLADAERP